VPKDGTATKERILAAAERLVIDHGFAATSLDQVITASGTSKGAFFHHFTSKLDLARSLVDRYAAADLAHLGRAVAQAHATTGDPVPLEYSIAWLTGAFASSRGRGDGWLGGSCSRSSACWFARYPAWASWCSVRTG
jgi:AcrR family transcriptional regulator